EAGDRVLRTPSERQPCGEPGMLRLASRVQTVRDPGNRDDAERLVRGRGFDEPVESAKGPASRVGGAAHDDLPHDRGGPHASPPGLFDPGGAPCVDLLRCIRPWGLSERRGPSLPGHPASDGPRDTLRPWRETRPVHRRESTPYRARASAGSWRPSICFDFTPVATSITRSVCSRVGSIVAPQMIRDVGATFCWATSAHRSASLIVMSVPPVTFTRTPWAVEMSTSRSGELIASEIASSARPSPT